MIKGAWGFWPRPCTSAGLWHQYRPIVPLVRAPQPIKAIYQKPRRCSTPSAHALLLRVLLFVLREFNLCRSRALWTRSAAVGKCAERRKYYVTPHAWCARVFGTLFLLEQWKIMAWFEEKLHFLSHKILYVSLVHLLVQIPRQSSVVRKCDLGSPSGRRMWETLISVMCEWWNLSCKSNHKQNKPNSNIYDGQPTKWLIDSSMYHVRAFMLLVQVPLEWLWILAMWGFFQHETWNRVL